MSRDSEVSLSVVRRLPRYYRFLGELLKEGCVRISSRELSEKMGLTASQIRQDLNCFGGFGQQGYGYNVEALYQEIAGILGIDKTIQTILVGVGNLGRAIVTHTDFINRGFKLIGAFDNNEKIIGQSLNNIKIMNVEKMEEFCETFYPSVAVLCIPKQAAREITQRLIDCGVQGFWNFSHYDINLNHENVIVENVHLSDSLMTLCYRVNHLGK